MPVLTIAEGVLEVGATHPDRQLFDCLMPLPFGTTYNAYLVIGQDKTALIDAVDPDKRHVMIQNLKDSGISRIDYLVHLHTEQDHSGTNADVRRMFPGAQTVAMPKVAEFLTTHIHLPADQIQVMQAGDILDLGGRTLKFLPIPFAHWPDNTMLWMEEERILFSSDLFGSHFATEKAFSTTGAELLQAAKAYYAEIMMPFAQQVAKHTQAAAALNPRLIAPAHGPVWKDPRVILSKYDRWTGNRVKKLVSIPYVSMHGSTRVMVEQLAARLSELGISTIVRDLGSRPDSLTIETGHFMRDLVDAAAVIFATPTVIGGPHPNAIYAALMASVVKPKTRFVGIIGSYGWAGRASETLGGFISGLKAEKLPALMVKGLPTADDAAQINAYAQMVADKINGITEMD